MTAEVTMPLQEGSEEGAGLHTAVSVARAVTPSFSQSEVSSCFLRKPDASESKLRKPIG